MPQPTPSSSSSSSSPPSLDPETQTRAITPPHSTSSPSSSHLTNPSSTQNPPPRLSALQFNSVIQPVLDSSHPSDSFQNLQPVKPEKCLTFCSQRNDGPPLCRMFCLRRRPIRTSQAEDLARLRPPITMTPLANEDTSLSSVAKVKERGDELRWKWTTPFDGLRKRLEPYSFIYARGTPDGVVGRYMEELEFDDGIRDFGAASRGTVESSRRTWELDKVEVLDWGTEGTLIHLPLTSIFYPVLLIPKTLTRIFTPTYNFLQAYKTSFTDGSQARTVQKLTETIQNGGALNVLKMLQERALKRAEQIKEMREKAAAEGKGSPGSAVSSQVQSGDAVGDEKSREFNEMVQKVNIGRDNELQRLKDRAAQRASIGVVKNDVEVKED